jgi:hypothetical protein
METPDQNEQAQIAVMQKFGNEVLSEMRRNIGMLSIHGKMELLRRVKTARGQEGLNARIGREKILEKMLKLKIPKNVPDKLVFQMNREGIMLELGTSRGHRINNPRQEKNFASSAIEKYIVKLANELTKLKGNEILLNVPSFQINANKII